MSYFPVDDQMTFHPKMIAAGNAAVGVWARAGAYAKSHTTGGFIPSDVAHALGKKESLRLVAVGLWDLATDELMGSGYQFHDWDHQAGNGDAETEKARRDRERERARERQAAKRERDSHTESHGVTEGVTPGNVTGTPVPVPVPLDVTDSANPPESSQVGDAATSGLDVSDVTLQKSKLAGIGNLPKVVANLSTVVGPLSAAAAVELVQAITARSKDPVNNADAYVATAVRSTPDEILWDYERLDLAVMP